MDRTAFAGLPSTTGLVTYLVATIIIATIGIAMIERVLTLASDCVPIAVIPIALLLDVLEGFEQGELGSNHQKTVEVVRPHNRLF